MIKKRIIPDNAVQGIWVSPYLARLESVTRCEEVSDAISSEGRPRFRGEPFLRSGHEVVSVRFDQDSPEYFRSEFDIEWTHSRID